MNAATLAFEKIQNAAGTPQPDVEETDFTALLNLVYFSLSVSVIYLDALATTETLSDEAALDAFYFAPIKFKIY